MATTNFNWTDSTGVALEVEANTAFEEMDASLSAVSTQLVTVSNAKTISDADFRANAVFIIDEDGGSPATAAITLTVPIIKRGMFTVVNNTAFTVTVTIAGQTVTAPTVATTDSVILNTDGADIRKPV